MVDNCGVCDNTTDNDGETCKVVADPDLTSPNAALLLTVQVKDDLTITNVAAAMAKVIGVDTIAISVRGEFLPNKTAEVALKGSYESVADDDGNRDAFDKQVQVDIAQLLHVNATRVVVDKVVAGSVVVTFTVLPDSTGVSYASAAIDLALNITSAEASIGGMEVINYTLAVVEVDIAFVIDSLYILGAGQVVSESLESLEVEVSQGAIVGLTAQSIFDSLLFECPAGFYTDESGACVHCAAGSEPNEAQDDCLPCTDKVTQQKSSWYSPIGAACVLCPAGKQPNDARTVCTKCEDNTFSDGKGTGCIACPSNQQQNAAADSCICENNFYNASQGVITCYGLGESFDENHFSWQASDVNDHCQPCDTTSGCVQCAGGTAQLMPGFVIGPSKEVAEVESLNTRTGGVAIFRCPLEAGCMGQTNESFLKCAVGYTGPLCAVCATNFVKSGLECLDCSDLSSSNKFMFLIVCLGLLVIASIVFKCFCSKEVEVGQQFNPNGEWARAMSQGKIVIGLFQMLSELPSTLQLVYPAKFTAAMQVLKLFMLDVFDLFKLDCVGSVSIYFKFVCIVVAPCIFVLVVHAIRKNSNKNIPISKSFRGASASMIDMKREENRAKADYRVLFGIFLMYPVLSRTCFHMFLCHKIGPGHSFHPDDYSIACEGSAIHALFLLFAVICTLIYPVGIPVSFLALLYRDKLKRSMMAKQQQAAGPTRLDRMRRSSVEMLEASKGGPSSMEFLRRDFKPEGYYYECIALFEKLLLIGLLIFISQGSSFQAFVGGLVAFVFFAIQARMWPYVHQEDNVLKATSQATIFVTLFVSVILRTDLNERSDTMDRDDYGTLLICALAATPVVWIFVMLRRLKLYRNRKSEESETKKQSLHKLAERGITWSKYGEQHNHHSKDETIISGELEEATSSSDDDECDTSTDGRRLPALPTSNFVFTTDMNPSPTSAEINSLLEQADKHQSQVKAVHNGSNDEPPCEGGAGDESGGGDGGRKGRVDDSVPPPPPPDKSPPLPPVASVSFRSPSMKTRVLHRHHASREELSTTKRMTASSNGVVHI